MQGTADKIRSRILGASGVDGNIPMIPEFGSESWKYTDLRGLKLSEFTAPTQGVPSQVTSGVNLVPTVTVDNGFVKVLSPTEGATVISLRDLYAKKDRSELENSFIDSKLGALLTVNQDNAYVTLNNNWLEDGVVVYVAKNTEAKTPVVISHRTTAGTVSYPRVLVVAEANSVVTVVEIFEGEAEKYLTVPVTEVYAESGAKVSHIKIQNESMSAYHLGTFFSKAEKDSMVASHLVNVGGAIVRNDIGNFCANSGGNIYLYGLTVVGEKQQIDNSTLLDHAMPHCESRELYKGIYAGEAKGVFTGTIIVREDAQKTNAFQQNQSVLLSQKAEINSRPQLKIWADDVKCTHGATVGQLDQEALFYMLSRGISREDAQVLLVKAFAGEVLAALPAGAIRDAVEAVVDTKLATF